ncbi:hypothetical protein ACGFNU_36510 [Spirillospora sp. NPDC048911]|uniref:hypothetical protein n=1 Tax=Spirillospora sp. NPDC048911 TaxID=3364527 RepID=UPI00371ED965
MPRPAGGTDRARGVRDALRPALTDPDPVVRVTAVYHLATHGEWADGVLDGLIRHSESRSATRL